MTEQRKFRSIAFVINQKKPTAETLGLELVALSKKLGLHTQLTTAYPLPKDFLKDHDICCVVGGDGTLLSTLQEAITHQVPVFGINQGKLGFLAAFTPQEAREYWKHLVQGHVAISYRSVLACSIENQPVLALNDIVLKSASTSRLVHLEVSSDNNRIAEYSCDGLIFTTPTGSTAYNLSAGGPIIHPDAKVFAMTPICPHTLSNRTIVFQESTTLTIHTHSPTRPFINFDGQSYTNHHTFPITISLSSQCFPVLHPPHYNYYKILRNKLQWG